MTAPSKKKTFRINGQNFSDLSGFYDEVERVLAQGLDWRIGRNLDAVNDVFWGGFGAFDYEEPIELVWIDAEKSRTDLSWSETIKYIESNLKTCHKSNRKYVKEELRLARKHKGETLFDMIVSMIQELEHIDLKLE
ncbi:MAG: barstar family protein [Bacteroidia bacterium]|nr:barstar family protein [Bacteroidia bacterium]